MLTDEPAYIDLLRRTLEEGHYRAEGGEGRYESFAQTLRFNLLDNRVPVLTTKKVAWRTAFIEMLWFISGSQYVQMLWEHGVHIWDTWADQNGLVGPLYGYQMRHWQIGEEARALHDTLEVDQLKSVINSLYYRPEARSHVISMWRPDHLPAAAIKPCHIYLQFYCRKLTSEEQRQANSSHDWGLSLSMTQRSCDLFLGVPFNLAQYAMLLHLVAKQIRATPLEFVWHGVDTHIYEDHLEPVKQQIQQPVGEMPRLEIAQPRNFIDHYYIGDLILVGYQPGPRLRAPISAQGTPGQAIEMP